MRALVSVYDKSGLDVLARGLDELGVEIVASGGTYRYIENLGISATKIEDITGFPEILDGRVKTLHPAVHGGILAMRTEKHLKQLEEHGLKPIDIVVVNLYPFEEVAKKTDDLSELIENIDIGGVALIRAAAKNYRWVSVLTSPEQYGDLLDAIKNGALDEDYRKKLALESFAYTARYDTKIYNTLQALMDSGLPEHLITYYRKKQDLRYGENPYQRAALYVDPSDERGIPHAEQLHGKEVSFNNIMDIDSALNMVRDFEKPTVAIIKHMNPCGLASADTLSKAYDKALASDPVSAFGSVIAVNRTLDEQTAEKMRKLFIEAIIAPGFEDSALEILEKKKNLRLLVTPELETEIGGKDVRWILGGALLQDRVFTPEYNLNTATEREPTEQELKDLKFAWKVVKHIKSNAIVFVKDEATVGVGAGQMSRVDSVKIAAMKAGDKAKGAVMASDAFFPFRDGVDVAAEAGITAVIEPGGSKRDDEVIQAANEHGMAMVFTGHRVFRH